MKADYIFRFGFWLRLVLGLIIWGRTLNCYLLPLLGSVQSFFEKEWYAHIRSAISNNILVKRPVQYPYLPLKEFQGETSPWNRSSQPRVTLDYLSLRLKLYWLFSKHEDLLWVYRQCNQLNNCIEAYKNKSIMNITESYFSLIV